MGIWMYGHFAPLAAAVLSKRYDGEFVVGEHF
jgi:hypothetical protein